MSPATQPDHERRLAHLRSRQIGMRGRVSLAVAAVGLVLSIALSLTTITVARNTLLSTRESALSRQALDNAETIQTELDRRGTIPTSELQDFLRSLPGDGTPSLSTPWTEGNGVSPDGVLSVGSLPTSLVAQVSERRESAIMRFVSNGEPLVAVGIPLPDSRAAYFEVNKLQDIQAAVRTLSLTLIVVIVLATALAMGLGFWASRYALLPLRRIGEAAESVALGQLDTRIDYDDYANDVDLAPLVANFNDMVSALQERIDRDARFASDVSHELRSPLTTLNASIDVLMNSRDQLPERSQQALDLLDLDLQRFTQLVEDLLEISRFDAGAVRLELDDILLVPTVEAAVRASTGAQVPVLADPSLDGVVVSCDKRRLMRILANFVDNAAKYADGATGVQVERHEPDPEDLDEVEPGPTVRIAVEDAGPGVPAAERSRIFDRFNRGDQGGSRGTDMGVGLGLALAAEHARLQGGRVWVEDRLDGTQGARFVVELPLLEDGAHPEDHERDDLASVTPEEAESYALTGEMPAIRLDTGGERIT